MAAGNAAAVTYSVEYEKTRVPLMNTPPATGSCARGKDWRDDVKLTKEKDDARDNTFELSCHKESYRRKTTFSLTVDINGACRRVKRLVKRSCCYIIIARLFSGQFKFTLPPGGRLIVRHCKDEGLEDIIKIQKTVTSSSRVKQDFHKSFHVIWMKGGASRRPNAPFAVRYVLPSPILISGALSRQPLPKREAQGRPLLSSRQEVYVRVIFSTRMYVRIHACQRVSFLMTL